MMIDKKNLFRRSQELLEEDQERAVRLSHSNAYHYHFEGYSEYYEVDPKSGKTRLKRVYTGVYYIRETSKKQLMLLKLALTLVWLASVGLFLLCASMPNAGNDGRYAAIVQAGALVGLAWAGIGLFNCWTVPARMTIGDWKSSSKKLCHGSICAIIFLALAAAVTLYYFFCSGGNAKIHISCAAGFLLSSGLMAAEYCMESHARYMKEQSKETAPKEAAHIR